MKKLFIKTINIDKFSKLKEKFEKLGVVFSKGKTLEEFKGTNGFGTLGRTNIRK